MNKLIKLSEDHYVVVDDSEINFGDYHVAINIVKTCGDKALAYTDNEQLKAISEIGGAMKVTHSTQPLDTIILKNRNGSQSVGNYYGSIGPISLSEIEELIYGYRVEKMAKEECEYNQDSLRQYDTKFIEFYKEGFNAHKELTKDKLFTVEDMIYAYTEGTNAGSLYQSIADEDFGEADEFSDQEFEKFKKSLLPKIEWDVKFNEQGKLELL